MSIARALRLFLLLFAIAARTAISGGGGDCPHLCECKWKSGKESVICLNANLSNVPLHLDAGTHVLHMIGNHVVNLKHDEFSSAGLVNLQKIYVSRCRLKNLDRYTFRHLINLIELDLSYNALAAVPSHTFDSISELRELKLNGNPIQRIVSDAFVYLPQLVRLELSECKISTIENKAFSGLERTLEFLKLDRNRLYTIAASSLTVLNNLNGIELADNLWNCTCELRPIREWMYQKNVPFGIPPHCQYPKRLEDKSWDKIDLDEFACSPEIFAFESKAFGVEGKNVTMTCQTKGTPEPIVRWVLKNKVIADFNSKKIYQQNSSSSDLTILAADLQDAGVYICTAENKAGKAEASVALTISKNPPKSTLTTKVFMASIIAGTIFVVASCLITLCIFTYKKKHAILWRRNDCHQDDTYEKIELNHHHGKQLGNNITNGRNSSEQHQGVIIRSQKKHGDYCVVPAGDTDQDEEYDEDEPDRSERETKIWKPGPIEERNVIGAELLDKREDLKDLHIPRRVINENIRDELNLPHHSYSISTASKSPYQSLPVTTQNRILPQVPPRNKKQPPTALDYSSNLPLVQKVSGYHPVLAGGSGLSNLAEEDCSAGPSGGSGRYPDLIENSPKKYSCANNNFHSRPASEGGSIGDINELFCTLPRKQQRVPNTSRYRSFDSQSPLLPESRYGSSGGDSTTSNSSSSRRLAEKNTLACKPRLNPNPTTTTQISSSYLNITNKRSPIQEVELLNNATPLLDIASLENRISYKQEPLAVTPTIATTNLNTYDYHAAQLERFLEEYRTLQKELTKMKETCDNMRQDKMQNSLPVTPSSANVAMASPNSNRSLALTGSGQFDSDLATFLSNQGAKNNRLLNNQ